MSEHIHADIVRPDGTVADIDRTPSPYWKHGASTPKPRRMLQPIKDELRRQLEVAKAEAIVLQVKLDEALPMSTVRRLVAVAVIAGFALGLFVCVFLP